jgi:hypothetical protein
VFGHISCKNWGDFFHFDLAKDRWWEETKPFIEPLMDYSALFIDIKVFHLFVFIKDVPFDFNIINFYSKASDRVPAFDSLFMSL